MNYTRIRVSGRSARLQTLSMFLIAWLVYFGTSVKAMDVMASDDGTAASTQISTSPIHAARFSKMMEYSQCVVSRSKIYEIVAHPMIQRGVAGYELYRLPDCEVSVCIPKGWSMTPEQFDGQDKSFAANYDAGNGNAAAMSVTWNAYRMQYDPSIDENTIRDYRRLVEASGIRVSKDHFADVGRTRAYWAYGSVQVHGRPGRASMMLVPHKRRMFLIQFISVGNMSWHNTISKMARSLAQNTKLH